MGVNDGGGGSGGGDGGGAGGGGGGGDCLNAHSPTRSLIDHCGAFVECICFCLGFLCFVVFYSSRETKSELHRTFWVS